MRYADVLLMYAEAKIELGEIDATVLACINDVRARAYGTTRTYCVRKHSQTDANEASRNSADFPMQTPHDAHGGALCAMPSDRLS